MEYVAPGAAISSRLALGPAYTGLVGTVRFRLIDNDLTADDPVYGPVTTSIIEDPSGSGNYVWNGTAPLTQGKFTPAWDTGPTTPLYYDEDIVVTRTAVQPFTPSGNEYVTRDELKEILLIQNETYADLAIDIAIESASRMCDAYKQTRFYPTAETRFYSPRWGGTEVYVDDLIEATAVHVDDQADGTYATQWIEGVDFYLNPTNAPLEEQPSTVLILRQQANRRFPRYARGLRIQGTFGWATTPILVKQAAILLANRYLTRTRSAPLGLLVATANEAVTAARLGRIDPDVAELLDRVTGTQHGSFRSVALG
jgi:hypothetical protein